MTTEHPLPAIDFDLGVPPEDIAPLDELPEERLAELFGQAQAAATANFLWASACVEEMRKRYEPSEGGQWATRAGRLFDRKKSTIYFYAKTWRVWQGLRGTDQETLDRVLQLPPTVGLSQVVQSPRPPQAARLVAEMVAALGDVSQRQVAARLRPLKSTGRGKRMVGAPLNFRAMLHEPVNEQGVVILFGMVAHDLGFFVDAIGTDFPDCRAKRRVKGGRLEEVRIEFEFKSRTFRNYHEPLQCDLIVCWEDDWGADSPVQVLELKSEIEKLKSKIKKLDADA